MKKYLLLTVAMFNISAFAHSLDLQQCQAVYTDYARAYAYDMACAQYGLNAAKTLTDTSGALERFSEQVDKCNDVLDEFYNNHPSEVEAFGVSLQNALGNFDTMNVSEAECKSELPKIQSLLLAH